MKLPASMTDMLFNLMLLFIFLSALGQPPRPDHPKAALAAAEKLVPKAIEKKPVKMDTRQGGDIKLPDIDGDFTTMLGFVGYRNGMARIGARFFIKDQQDRIIAEVDPLIWKIRPAPDTLLGLSARWRQFDDVPEAMEVLNEAKAQFGDAAESVILLLPTRVESKVADVLHDFSNRNGFQFAELNRVLVTYFTLNGRLFMEVYRAEVADGRILPANLRIDLGSQ